MLVITKQVSLLLLADASMLDPCTAADPTITEERVTKRGDDDQNGGDIL
jgi:hypothetical protein